MNSDSASAAGVDQETLKLSLKSPGCHFRKKLLCQHPVHTNFGNECSWLMWVTEIDVFSLSPLICIKEPCVSGNASGILGDCDPQAVYDLAGEMKIHRRANTINLGITVCRRIHQKSCLATERSSRGKPQRIGQVSWIWRTSLILDYWEGRVRTALGQMLSIRED